VRNGKFLQNKKIQWQTKQNEQIIWKNWQKQKFWFNIGGLHYRWAKRIGFSFEFCKNKMVLVSGIEPWSIQNHVLRSTKLLEKTFYWKR
jgi:hypothetical protein